MEYYWLGNETTEVWYRNKHKPRENHKKINDGFLPLYLTIAKNEQELYRYRELKNPIYFLSSLEQIPELFGVFRLTNNNVGFTVNGNIFRFIPSLIQEGKNYFGYSNSTEKYIDSLFNIKLTIARPKYNWDDSYEVKFNGAPVYNCKNSKGSCKFNQSTLDIYTEVFQKIPSIIDEIRASVPQFKPLKLITEKQ